MISDYLFKDMETGENFFVETDSKENAIEIANQYFDNARCIMRLDVEDAERWGLDTYQCPFFLCEHMFLHGRASMQEICQNFF